MVFYNYIVDGEVAEAQIPYPKVLERTGLKDQVGLAGAGYVEYFAPVTAVTITAEMVAMGVRNLRLYLLTQSDWTQANDSPLSSAKKTEWGVYRQKLRDMPATHASATDLTAITPPTPPE